MPETEKGRNADRLLGSLAFPFCFHNPQSRQWFQETSMMEDLASQIRLNLTMRNDENCLENACDAGIATDACLTDTVNTLDNEDSNDPLSSDSECSESSRLSNLVASLRVLSESLARLEKAEMEMIKARQVLRWEAEKRRMESEAELTGMMLQTQLQIVSLFAGQGPSRKRKLTEEDRIGQPALQGKEL